MIWKAQYPQKWFQFSATTSFQPSEPLFEFRETEVCAGRAEFCEDTMIHIVGGSIPILADTKYQEKTEHCV